MELVVAVVAGVFSIASVIGTIWSTARTDANALEIAKLKNEADQLKEAAARQREISKLSEPLARSVYELQGRIYIVLNQRFLVEFMTNGKEREKTYGLNHTAFVVAQYFCWTELVRREIQFIDLGESEKTRNLALLQDAISLALGTGLRPPLFRLYEGEQRAIGDALIVQAPGRAPVCMGYGAFVTAFPPGKDPLIDMLRAHVTSAETGLDSARPRLTQVQHQLLKLLELLDPKQLRFPKDRLSPA
jgi:hypothetical protein